MHGLHAGTLTEESVGYSFTYAQEYLQDGDAPSISLTMPKRSEPYTLRTMLPFFDGLIPEGWMLDIAIEQWKLNRRDRMGLLLAVCEDTVGAVQIFDAS